MKNDWGLTYNTIYAVSKGKKRTNEKESFAVKLCPKCNNAYETTPNQYKKIPQTHYYEGFPRRGLHLHVCLKCNQGDNMKKTTETVINSKGESETITTRIWEDGEPQSPADERPIDATEDYTSDCCDAPFGYPGWPDSDICSECFEHAGVSEEGNDE